MRFFKMSCGNMTINLNHKIYGNRKLQSGRYRGSNYEGRLIWQEYTGPFQELILHYSKEYQGQAPIYDRSQQN